MPSFSLQEYYDLLEYKRRRQSGAPEYQFTAATQVAGRITGDVAELEATISFRVLGDAAPAWRAIPLGLADAVIAPDVRHEGGGDLLLEQTNGQRTAWIKADGGSDHQLVLRLRVPVTVSGLEYKLAVRLPPHAALVQLGIPGQHVQIVAGGSSTVVSQNRAADETNLRLETAGGELTLAWREQQQLPGVIEANGAITIDIKGRDVSALATLRVRSRGTAIDAFQVRLPAGMQLLDFAEPGYHASLAARANEQDPLLVLIRRVDGKTTEVMQVSLEVWRPPADQRGRTEIDVAGFEVVGAHRQWGTIDFRLNTDWMVDWQTGQSVYREVDLSEPLRKQGISARFHFDRQPCSLPVVLRQKQPRVTVEPQFTLALDTEQARLDAAMNYNISGAALATVFLDMPGWTVDQIAPADVLRDTFSQDENGRIALPIAETRQTGPLQFQLRAHRALGPLPQDQLLTLPRPVASTSLAKLTVRPADSVLVSWNPEKSVGWLPDSGAAESAHAATDQLALSFSEQAAAESSPPAVFAVLVSLRPRAIEAKVDSHVHRSAAALEVEQRLHFTVRHQATDTLLLDAPTSVLANGSLHMELDAREVAFTAQPVTAPDAARTRLTVALGSPRIGEFLLLARHDQPLGARPSPAVLVAEASADTVPLVQPAADAATTVVENRVRVSGQDAENESPLDANWRLAAPSPTSDAANAADPSDVAHAAVAPRVYVTDGPAADLRWGRTGPDPQRAQRTRIHRVWLQTWFSARERQDRVCLRIRNPAETLELQLPAEVRVDRLQVAVDGYEAAWTWSGSGRVRVRLAAPAAAVSVELWYWFDVRPAALGRVAVQLPSLVGDSQPPPVYWQLVLPEGEHLLWTPPETVRENLWRRDGLFWRRVPALSQVQLEQWSDAATHADLPTTLPNYLFSSHGGVDGLSFYTATRSSLVAIASGLALVIFLPLILAPRLRHPALFVVLGVAVGAGGLVFPEAAILIGQAALGGIALLLLSGLRQVMSGSRTRTATIVRGGSADSRSRVSGKRLPEPNGRSSVVTGAITAYAEPEL